MTKNKKKLRRAERRYSVTKSAQTLVLAGMLLAGGVSGAMAAADVTKDTTDTVSSSDLSGVASGNKLIVTANAGATANVTVTTGDALTVAGGLLVKGASNGTTPYTATFIIDHNSSFAEAIAIGGGATGETGILQINAGKTLTSTGNTTVSANGSLVLLGDATTGAIHTGNVTLDGAGATLNVSGGAAGNMNTLTGDLTVTSGQVNVGTNAAGQVPAQNGFLTVSGASSIGNGGMTIADNSVAYFKNDSLSITAGGAITASKATVGVGGTYAGTATDAGLYAGKTLTLAGGELVVANGLTVNNASAANAELVQNTAASSIYGDVALQSSTLTLTGNTLTVYTAGSFGETDKTLGNLSITDKTVLAGGAGNLVTGTLNLGNRITLFGNDGTTNAALNITTNKVVADAAYTLGTATIVSAGATNALTIRGAATGTTEFEDFLGNDVTVVGNHNSGTNSTIGTLTLGTSDAGYAGGGVSEHNITLASADNSANAKLNVGYGTWDVADITVGADVATSGKTGTITVSNGGTLKADTVSLYGLSGQVAKLDIKDNTNGGKAEFATLNVGSANTYGTVTLEGNAATDKNSSLSVGALNLNETKGQIDIGAYSKLHVTGTQGLEISGSKLGTSLTGGINVADNSSLQVDKTLTLKGDGTAAVTTTLGAAGAAIVAEQLVVSNTGTNGFVLNTGTVTLKSDGNGNVLTANKTEVLANGTLNFGDGITAGKGTVNTQIKTTAGTTNFKKGDWTLNDLNSAGGTVNITSDSNVTALKMQGTGDVAVAGTLTAQLKDFGKIDTGATKSLNVGTAIYTGDITGDGFLTLDGLSAGTYAGTDLTLADVKAIRGSVVASGAGNDAALSLSAYTVSIDPTAADGKLSNVSGVDAYTATAGLSSSETLTANASVKDLQVQAAVGDTGTIAVGLGGKLLQVVGGGENSKLITNLKDGQTVNITTGGGTLALGRAGTEGGGTLKANITDAGKITATNGAFTVDGTVTAKQNAIDVTGKSLTFSKGNISTTASALDGGTLSATDKTSGSLSIDTLTTTANGGTVVAAKNLSLTNTAILNGTTIMEAGGNVSAGTNDIATTKGDLSITATNGDIIAQDISAGEGKAQLILNAGKAINATGGGIQGGDNSFIKAAKLNADTVTLAGGVFNLTGNDKATSSILTGALELGSDTPNKLSAVAGNVDGKLDLRAGGSLVGGSSLAVNELTLTGTMNVGSNVEKSTGTLSVNKLADGGTIFADPAWIAGTEHSTSYASQVAIAAFDNTANELKSNIVGGQASQIVLGTKDTAWVKNKLDEYNAAYHTNIWGPKAGQVTAALGITKAVTLNGAGLYIDGAPTTDATKANVAGNAHFGENSLLIVDANSVGADTALTAGNINVADKAKLMLTNVTVGTEYSVAKATTGLTIGEGSWDGANILTDHRLLTGVLNTKDKEALVTINQRSATSVLPGLSSEMGGLIDNMIKQNHTSENSPHAGVRFANRAINRLNGDQAAATIEGAAQLAVVGAAPAMTLSAVQAGTSTVTTRTSFASPLLDSSKAVALHKDVDGTLSVDSGLNAGNGMKNGFGLWIMPLYQSNSAWGMKADGFKGGYKSDLGGVALGADYTFNDMFRLGLAFNIGGGYAESNGDFNKTENSFNFWGINAYGGWTMNNFGITADVGYTGNYNKLEQELPGAMGMSDIKSDVNSSAWTAGLRGEYKFATEALDIIPHVGVRYTGLTTDEYKAKSGGDTVFKVDQSFQSIWTFPIGVTLAKEIETGSGWIIRPQVDLGITPATGDVKAKSKTRIPGVDAQAEMKMQVVDYMSYDGGLGLEMKKDNVSFGINYNIQASEHRTGHGVFGTFRYEF